MSDDPDEHETYRPTDEEDVPDAVHQAWEAGGALPLEHPALVTLREHYGYSFRLDDGGEGRPRIYATKPDGTALTGNPETGFPIKDGHLLDFLGRLSQQAVRSEPRPVSREETAEVIRRIGEILRRVQDE